MKEKYRELFDEVHLSETAIKEMEERRETFRGSRLKILPKKKRIIEAAALLLLVLVLGSSGAGAAIYYSRMDSQVGDSRAEIDVHTTEPEEKEEAAFYDVKLSYLPKGYEQDKEDSYLYRDKEGEGYFCVILYHLQTEYHTVRAAENMKKFQSDFGQGYYGGKGKGYFAILVFTDSNYMVCIDGSNMPEKEVKKIAQGASLMEVAGKKDVQASRIEWTEERQKEVNDFRQKFLK